MKEYDVEVILTAWIRVLAHTADEARREAEDEAADSFRLGLATVDAGEARQVDTAKGGND